MSDHPQHMTREHELVQLFRGSGDDVRTAMDALAGGWSATVLKNAHLTDAAYEAVVAGLSDPHPRVRWWCVTILDHIPDPRAIEAIVPLLDDPVPRVRRNTAHALGCVLCKPEWCGILDPAALAKLEHRAANDENARVRRDATIALFQLATAQAS